MRAERLDPSDDVALDELLQFAARHGRPRATKAVAYRALLAGDITEWQAFVMRAADRSIRAVALATISPAIGLDQVQLNAFLAHGEDAAFSCVLDDVGSWSRERGAVCVTAHVSAPSEGELASWLAAGFEQIGERQRVVRHVTIDDAHIPGVAIDDVEIVALAEHPELDEAAEQVWHDAHDDVPSALRFGSDSLPTLRAELGLAPGERPSPLVLVACARDGEVAGLVVGIRRYTNRPTVLAHRMTTTARGWRGRGIAHALKVELLRRAATDGVTQLEASNDDGNAPMQAINARLGYELDYRLVLLRRDL